MKEGRIMRDVQSRNKLCFRNNTTVVQFLFGLTKITQHISKIVSLKKKKCNKMKKSSFARISTGKTTVVGTGENFNKSLGIESETQRACSGGER